MSNKPNKHNKHTKYRQIKPHPTRLDSDGSYFDKYPTITVKRYWIPKQYKDAVSLTINIYRSGISFNKAADQAHAVYPSLNRNKLVEHTLKYIANDY